MGLKDMMRRRLGFSFLLFLIAVLAESQQCGTLVREPSKSYFVLVVDQSGSMKGEPLERAFMGILYFIREMGASDEAALIAFESKVHVLCNFTSDKNRLYKYAEKIHPPKGRTRIYDAIAAGARMLAGKRGQKVIVFLTDGRDNESTFTLEDIRQMNIGEGIFVYGIGLGDIEHIKLEGLATATGGKYRIASGPEKLVELYHEVQQKHYEVVERQEQKTGGYSISSIPLGRPVFVDGKEIGSTPVKIDNVPEGRHVVEVHFNKGIWKCDDSVQAGYRTYIRARESEVPADLIVETAPPRAAVFIDGAYVGLSSMLPSFSNSYENQLRIRALPKGKHTLKVIAAPDFEFSAAQKWEFEFQIGDKSRYVKVYIFMRRAEFGNGEVIHDIPFSGGF